MVARLVARLGALWLVVASVAIGAAPASESGRVPAGDAAPSYSYGGPAAPTDLRPKARIHTQREGSSRTTSPRSSARPFALSRAAKADVGLASRGLRPAVKIGKHAYDYGSILRAQPIARSSAESSRTSAPTPSEWSKAPSEGKAPAGRAGPSASVLAAVKRDETTIATYDYDANGNRTSTDVEGTAPVTAEHDDHDRLLRHGTSTYRYTSNGELRERTTAGESTLYSYDAAGSLTTVQLPDGRTVRYVTDGLGRRIATKIDGTLQHAFVYGEAALPSAELNSDGQVRSRFVYATRSTVPDYLQRGGRTYRLITDQLGSVRLVTDTQTGETAQRIDYDPYGRTITDTNPGFQPFGYAGGLYDPNTGLVRYGARDYDPDTGRWTAKDPIDFAGGDTNLYAYVTGDPINHIDPTGNIAFLAVVAIAYKATAVISALDTINRALHGCASLTEVAADLAGGKLARAGITRAASGYAAKGASGAENAVSGKLLTRQLASQEQMAGSGSPIIGAGTSRGLRDAPRLAREYGGDASDWAKMSSERYRDGGGIYDLFETHWYENVRTGARYEFKTKFPRAENMFGGPGG